MIAYFALSKSTFLMRNDALKDFNIMYRLDDVFACISNIIQHNKSDYTTFVRMLVFLCLRPVKNMSP